jgi:hypothetical protein
MSIKKRKLKNRIFQEFKIFFLAFAGILILFSAGYLIVRFALPKKELYLSPMAKQLSAQNHNNLESELEKYNIPVNTVDVASDSSYLISLKDGSQVIVSPTKNIDNQISSLQLILSRLTIEGKRFRLLDFRYDKPVIVF